MTVIPKEMPKSYSPSQRAKQYKTHQDPDAPLTIKERKFVAARISGKSQGSAALEAGSQAKDLKSAQQVGITMDRKANVRRAIEEALVNEGATPQWAASQLVKIAKQDIELEVKRKAVMDILKLHGWKEGEKPEIALEIKNAFFGTARKARTIIDASPEESR